jgi:Tol biopolymer transport system component
MKTSQSKRLLAAAICGLIVATTLSNDAQAQTVSRIAFSALVQPVTKGKAPPAYQQIFSINPDGTSSAQLTSASANSLNPAWSPGQRYISFCRTNTLYVMEARGELNGGRSFAVCPAGNWGSDWSPDGAHLCFMGSGSVAGLWTVAVNPATGQADAPVLVRAGDAYWPAWSPDGSRIAICSSYDGGNTQVIVVFNLATGAENSFNVSNSFNSYDYSPRWKPDGTQIAFSGGIATTTTTRKGTTTSSYNEIFVANPDGTGITRLTDYKNYSAFPAWSPDGSTLVFRSDFSGASSLYTMPLATGVVTLLRLNANAPDWAP